MKIRIIALLFVFALVMTGCSKGGERLVQRPNPETQVSAEEFEKEYGFSLFVPEGAEDVSYVIDMESHRGTMNFKLNDTYWSARVMRADDFKSFNNFYVDDSQEEIDSLFDSNQDIRVLGVEPVIRYFRIHYVDNSEAYSSEAMWFLEDKRLMIGLDCFSEKQVHKMPVEVFDQI